MLRVNAEGVFMVRVVGGACGRLSYLGVEKYRSVNEK